MKKMSNQNWTMDDNITKSYGFNGKPSKIQFSHSTIFLAACASTDLAECERLLCQDRVNVNCTNVDGLTALHQACIDDNIKMVRFLLDHGANINCCDYEGWTPLHATSSCGNETIVRLLLDRGADPRIINYDGELACDLTDSLKIKGMIDAKLRELGVTDVDVLRQQEHICMLSDVNNWIKTQSVDDKPHPRSGATILHVAAAKGYIDILGALLNNRTLRSQLDIEARDNEGWTPLAAACYWQKPGAVQLLILHGADVNTETDAGQHLLDLTDHELIVQIIEERRQKLAAAAAAEEQKLRDIQMKSAVSQTKVPPSPPSAPTSSTESETQRKAHAKRVRETRRSTQGVSAEDIKQAKEQMTSSIMKQPSPQSEPVSSADESKNQTNSIANTPIMISSTNITAQSKPPITSNHNHNYHHNMPEISNSLAPSPVNLLSFNNADSQVTVSDKSIIDTNNTNIISSNQNNRPTNIRSVRCRLPSTENDQSDQSSQSIDNRTKYDNNGSTKCINNELKRDYRQLYESLVKEMETLKRENLRKEHEWNRERRTFQRKLSELEEEIKQLEVFKSDNKRLNDENDALVRVISKLSK